MLVTPDRTTTAYFEEEITLSEPMDLPRLPDGRFDPEPRAASDLKPGERIVLSSLTNLSVDEEGHVWVDASTQLQSRSVVPGLTLQAERIADGFILWLDEEVRFQRGKLHPGRTYLPVVEFREAAEAKA